MNSYYSIWYKEKTLDYDVVLKQLESGFEEEKDAENYLKNKQHVKQHGKQFEGINFIILKEYSTV